MAFCTPLFLIGEMFGLMIKRSGWVCTAFQASPLVHQRLEYPVVSIMDSGRMQATSTPYLSIARRIFSGSVLFCNSHGSRVLMYSDGAPCIVGRIMPSMAFQHICMPGKWLISPISPMIWHSESILKKTSSTHCTRWWSDQNHLWRGLHTMRWSVRMQIPSGRCSPCS